MYGLKKANTEYEDKIAKMLGADGLSASEALNDYGCRHYRTPIICGVSEPRWSDADIERSKQEHTRVIDKMFVEKCETVEEGEIGIFILNGEACIKELGKRCLISHNEAYKPIALHSTDSVYCCGKVLGVVEE